MLIENAKSKTNEEIKKIENEIKMGLSSKVCKFIFKGKNNQSQVFVFKNPCL